MTKKVSLKRILVISFIFGLLLPAATGGVIFFKISSSKMRDELVRRNMFLAKSMAGEVDRFLLEPKRILNHIGNVINSSAIAPGKINTYLNSIIENYRIFESIQVINRKGRVKNVAPFNRDIMGVRVMTDQYRDFINFGGEDGKLYMSPSFISVFTNEATIAVSSKQSDFVFIAYLKLKSLQKIIKRIKITEGYSFITDRNGVLIAHNDEKLVRERTSYNNINAVRETLKGRPGVHYFKHEGVDYLGCARTAGNGSMVVVLVQPVNEIFSPVVVLKYYGVVGLVFVLTLVFVTGLLMLSKVMRPLEGLISKTVKVAEGDYSMVRDFAGYSELESIWENFEEMILSVKNREKALVNARNYMRSLFNAQSSILIAVDADGIVVQYNDAAEAFFSGEENLKDGRKFWDIFNFLNGYQHRILECIKDGGGPRMFEVTLSGNSEKFFLINCYPSEFEQNRGGLVRIDDITELKRNEKQLFQMHKMETVGTLAGGLAHDFNNIMTGIMGTLSIIQMQLEQNKEITSEKLNRYVKIMNDTAERATGIMKQLLTLSKGHQVALNRFDLKELILDVASLFRSSVDKSINFTVEIIDDKAEVVADIGQIEQVILNLCINAAHAMTILRPHGDTWGGDLNLKLSAFCGDDNEDCENGQDYWRIDISDTGIGMDNELLKKIFDPFFTTKKEGEGTGLGLSMVYSIISKHKGHLEIDSRPGEGTRFSIFIPSFFDAEIINSEDEDDSREYPRGKGTVLVIDDEQVMLEIEKDILQSCGYDVIAVNNAAEGLRIYEERSGEIAVVILDMSMPGFSGKELYEKMSYINPNIKALLVSGFHRDGRIDEMMDLGINAFLHKPFTFRKLAEAIHSVVYD